MDGVRSCAGAAKKWENKIMASSFFFADGARLQSIQMKYLFLFLTTLAFAKAEENQLEKRYQQISQQGFPIQTGISIGYPVYPAQTQFPAIESIKLYKREAPELRKRLTKTTTSVAPVVQETGYLGGYQPGYSIIGGYSSYQPSVSYTGGYSSYLPSASYTGGYTYLPGYSYQPTVTVAQPAVTAVKPAIAAVEPAVSTTKIIKRAENQLEKRYQQIIQQGLPIQTGGFPIQTGISTGYPVYTAQTQFPAIESIKLLKREEPELDSNLEKRFGQAIQTPSLIQSQAVAATPLIQPQAVAATPLIQQGYVPVPIPTYQTIGVGAYPPVQTFKQF